MRLFKSINIAVVSLFAFFGAIMGANAQITPTEKYRITQSGSTFTAQQQYSDDSWNTLGGTTHTDAQDAIDLIKNSAGGAKCYLNLVNLTVNSISPGMENCLEFNDSGCGWNVEISGSVSGTAYGLGLGLIEIYGNTTVAFANATVTHIGWDHSVTITGPATVDFYNCTVAGSALLAKNYSSEEQLNITVRGGSTFAKVALSGNYNFTVEDSTINGGNGNAIYHWNFWNYNSLNADSTITIKNSTVENTTTAQSSSMYFGEGATVWVDSYTLNQVNVEVSNSTVINKGTDLAIYHHSSGSITIAGNSSIVSTEGAVAASLPAGLLTLHNTPTVKGAMRINGWASWVVASSSFNPGSKRYTVRLDYPGSNMYLVAQGAPFYDSFDFENVAPYVAVRLTSGMVQTDQPTKTYVYRITNQGSDFKAIGLYVESWILPYNVGAGAGLFSTPQLAVGAIRTDANANACTIWFGDGSGAGSADELNAGDSGLVFDAGSPAWTDLTLRGKITGSRNTSGHVLISAVGGNASTDLKKLTSYANMTLALAQDTFGMQISGAFPAEIKGGSLFGTGNGTMLSLQNGATVSTETAHLRTASNANTISLAGASKLTVNSGTVEQTSNGHAIHQSGTGATLDIKGGNVKSANGAALNITGAGVTALVSGNAVIENNVNSVVNANDGVINCFGTGGTTLTLTGGTVINRYDGDAVIIAGGTLNISGGTITAGGNRAAIKLYSFDNGSTHYGHAVVSGKPTLDGRIRVFYRFDNKLSVPDLAPGTSGALDVTAGPYTVSVDDGEEGDTVVWDGAPYLSNFVLGSWNAGLNLAASGKNLIFGAPSPFDGGDGTEQDPFLISDWQQLRAIDGHLGAWFKLENDLNPADGVYTTGTNSYTDVHATSAGWAPIGTRANPFMGHFDGNGKTIRGYWVNVTDPGEQAGLFGSIKEGTVKNLNLVIHPNGVKYTRTSGVVNGGRAGGLAGEMFVILGDALLEDISVSGGPVWGYSSSGGIVGALTMTRTIIRGKFSNSSEVTGVNAEAGGIVGNFGGTAEPAAGGTVLENSGPVNGTTYAGGIFGFMVNPLVQMVFDGQADVTKVQIKNTGNVKSIAGSGLATGFGGVFGYMLASPSIIQNYVNTVDVEVAHGQSYAGGIVGWFYAGTIQQCYNTGTISANSVVGGIVGRMSLSSSVVKGVYNLGTIKGNESGGLVGIFDGSGTLASGYNAGRVTGNNCGAAVGFVSGGTPPTNLFYDKIASGITDATPGVTGLTTDALAAQVVPAGLTSGNNYWTTGHEGLRTYPYFPWQLASGKNNAITPNAMAFEINAAQSPAGNGAISVTADSVAAGQTRLFLSGYGFEAINANPYTKAGWSPSPMFDVNQVGGSGGNATGVQAGFGVMSESDIVAFMLAPPLTPEYRIQSASGAYTVDQKDTVGDWHSLSVGGPGAPADALKAIRESASSSMTVGGPNCIIWFGDASGTGQGTADELIVNTAAQSFVFDGNASAPAWGDITLKGRLFQNRGVTAGQPVHFTNAVNVTSLGDIRVKSEIYWNTTMYPSGPDWLRDLHLHAVLSDSSGTVQFLGGTLEADGYATALRINSGAVVVSGEGTVVLQINCDIADGVIGKDRSRHAVRMHGGSLDIVDGARVEVKDHLYDLVSSVGFCIAVYEDSTLYINGPTTVVSSDTHVICLAHTAHLTMDGGTVTGTRSTLGGSAGVSCYDSSTLTVNGGLIHSASYRGIDNYSSGAINITGGTITANTAITSTYGANTWTISGNPIITGVTSSGINASDASTWNISGGTFSGRSSVISVYGASTWNISGGTITNRYEPFLISSSDAILVNGGATINLSGGTVHSYQRAGNGINLNHDFARLNISGNPSVTSEHTGVAVNLQHADAEATISGSPTLFGRIHTHPGKLSVKHDGNVDVFTPDGPYAVRVTSGAVSGAIAVVDGANLFFDAFTCATVGFVHAKSGNNIILATPGAFDGNSWNKRYYTRILDQFVVSYTPGSAFGGDPEADLEVMIYFFEEDGVTPAGKPGGYPGRLVPNGKGGYDVILTGPLDAGDFPEEDLDKLVVQVVVTDPSGGYGPDTGSTSPAELLDGPSVTAEEDLTDEDTVIGTLDPGDLDDPRIKDEAVIEVTLKDKDGNTFTRRGRLNGPAADGTYEIELYDPLDEGDYTITEVTVDPDGEDPLVITAEEPLKVRKARGTFGGGDGANWNKRYYTHTLNQFVTTYTPGAKFKGDPEADLAVTIFFFEDDGTTPVGDPAGYPGKLVDNGDGYDVVLLGPLVGGDGFPEGDLSDLVIKVTVTDTAGSYGTDADSTDEAEVIDAGGSIAIEEGAVETGKTGRKVGRFTPPVNWDGDGDFDEDFEVWVWIGGEKYPAHLDEEGNVILDKPIPDDMCGEELDIVIVVRDRKTKVRLAREEGTITTAGTDWQWLTVGEIIAPPVIPNKDVLLAWDTAQIAWYTPEFRARGTVKYIVYTSDTLKLPVDEWVGQYDTTVHAADVLQVGTDMVRGGSLWDQVRMLGSAQEATRFYKVKAVKVLN